MRYWFHKKHAFRDHTTPGSGTGIFMIGDSATLSLAGGWVLGVGDREKTYFSEPMSGRAEGGFFE
jgi:hypothetical protein